MGYFATSLFFFNSWIFLKNLLILSFFLISEIQTNDLPFY